MRNFVYHVPTEVVFGVDAEQQTAQYVKKYGGSRVLVVYGGGSAVRSGLLDRICNQLKDAGIITVEMGPGGAAFTRPAEQITLLDVYRAVESTEDHLFNFHENPNAECPVGRNIHAVLDSELDDAQKALEDRLAQTSIADLLARIDTLVAEQQ